MRRCVLILCAGMVLPALPRPAERIQVLFLGDRGHHHPHERVAAVHAPLFRRGIQLEYTEDLAALSRQNLARFDVVAVYANHTEIDPDQERALVEFVRGGGGLAAIHCASACFPGSPRYVALVGGRFASHGAGTFTTRAVAPGHPLVAGHRPFTSWDETYVHADLTDDRTVLSVRERAPDEPGGAGDEPWTWVRDEGAGRVFYTASGHDLRTWTDEGFVDLIARGIRWAAGEEDPGALPAPPPFEYVRTDTAIPDYVSGRTTGASHTMQAPLDPASSLGRLGVAAGLEARLFASEPLLSGKPICLAFDARGRAWVLETVDYPNERRDEDGRDRIVVLEDTDGDGRADRRIVFADGLSIPTSVAFANGGVVVTQAPHTLFLRDLDGDDVADERRVLFSGWGTGDTHAGPPNLRAGFDNRLWGTVGYSGFRGTVGGERHAFAQAVFAFEPDGSALEIVASTTNNTWGLGLSEDGSVFASTANGNPSVHVALAARHYERVPGLAPGALRTIAERMDLHPVTGRVRQVDFHGKFTAAAGHSLYTARLLPERYWNRVAFVNAPTGHAVAQLALEHDGSDYVARDAWNLVASDDEWTAPILAETGPDGAVWVVDWYSYIVQHNPTPPGFETGRGNAYETDLRDKTRGRIWRIVPGGAAVPPDARDLTTAAPDELVATLRDPNLLWRQHAQRLLVERGEPDVVPALLAYLAEPDVDAVGNDPAALHALWTLEGIGVFAGAGGVPEETADAAEDALVRALRHPAWSVRRAALELLPRVEWARDVIVTSGLLDDPSGKVRLAALTSLAAMPASDAAGAAAFAALQRAAAEEDRWLCDAATIAGAAHDTGFLKAVLASRLAGEARGGAPGERRNLVPNPSFEEGGEDRADGWTVRTYGGVAEHRVVRDVARGGERSLRISSGTGADSSAFCELELDPGATYRVTAWIRTEELARGSGRGAQLNVHELQSPAPVRTDGVDGTDTWRQVETTFDAQGRDRVTLNCLFGGWGWSTGTAWYDDVRVTRVGDPLIPGAVGAALPRVMSAYAARGPLDSVVSTLCLLEGTPAALSGALLEGLANGWPKGLAPALDDADRATLAALADGLEEEPRARLAGLLAVWGVDTDDVVDVEALTASLTERIADGGAEVAARVAAAERLVALGRGAAALAACAAVLEPTTEPELATGLVRALGTSAQPELAGELADAWPRLGPQARRVAVATMLRRDAWTTALLRRIAGGRLPASVLDAAQWSSLEQRAAGTPLAELVAEARGKAVDPDRAAVVERYRPALELEGEPARGRDVYAEQCSKCHVLAGGGIRIGPDLDGIGARAPEELLIAILDPDRSVEGTYQLWTARTKDGVLASGRLASETRTVVELVDSNGDAYLLERAELEELTPSQASIMPAGLEEEVDVQGIADLLAFLAGQRR